MPELNIHDDQIFVFSWLDKFQAHYVAEDKSIKTQIIIPIDYRSSIYDKMILQQLLQFEDEDGFRII